MALSKEEYIALRKQGHTNDDIALIEKQRASLPQGVPSELELMGPRANTNRWMSAIPFAAGALGAAAGGALGDSPLSAGLGFRAGASLPIALGELSGAFLGGAGGEAAKEGIAGQPFEAGSIGRSGLAQAGLQLPATAMRMSASGLGKAASMAQRRAGNKAEQFAAKKADIERPMLEKQRQQASDIRKAQLMERRAAVKAARMERIQSSQEARKLVSASTDKVTAAEIADHMIQSHGLQLSKNQRIGLIQDVRDQLGATMNDITLGTYSRRPTVLSMSEAQRIKQRIGQIPAVQSQYGRVASGKAPVENMPKAISEAMKELIENKVPGIKEVNARTSAAIEAVQDLSKTGTRVTDKRFALQEEQRLAKDRALAATTERQGIEKARAMAMALERDPGGVGLNPAFGFSGLRRLGGINLPSAHASLDVLSRALGGAPLDPTKANTIGAIAPYLRGAAWLTPRAVALASELTRPEPEKEER